MSVAEIETRLEHRFALLRGGDRSSPARHRTLHAVIEWSWNLLDPEQQVALRRLCRFPAGFTLAAAEFVLDDADVGDAGGAVGGLVSQSLLTVLTDDDGVATRYRMLETVREFGEERLVDSGEIDLVEARMCDWATEFALDIARRYPTDAQLDVVRSLSAEVDNLQAVLRTAVDRADAATVYSVFAVVAGLWVMRGAHMELVSWAPRIVEVAPPVGAHTREHADLEMQTYIAVGSHLTFARADPRVLAVLRARARALLKSSAELSPILRFGGQVLCLRPTVRRLGRLLAEGVRSPDDGVRAAALMLRANLRENNSDVHGSMQDGRRLLAIVEPRDAWGTAMACQHLGQMSSQLARYAESARYYRRAADLLQQLQSYEESVEIVTFAAVSLVGAGQLNEARAELEFAHGMVADDTRPDVRVAQPNYRLGVVVVGTAELELAEGHIERGLRTYRRALDLVSWPEDLLPPGPGDILVASAVLGAHLLYRRLDEAAALPRQLVEVCLQRLAQFYDLPQIGAVACVIGSYLVATDTDSGAGLTLLALAAKVAGREDMPSVRRHRHLEMHRRVVGAAAVESAQQAVVGLNRRAAAVRVMDAFSDIVARLPE